ACAEIGHDPVWVPGAIPGTNCSALVGDSRSGSPTGGCSGGSRAATSVEVGRNLSKPRRAPSCGRGWETLAAHGVSSSSPDPLLSSGSLVRSQYGSLDLAGSSGTCAPPPVAAFGS